MFRLFKKDPPLVDQEVLGRGERAEHLLQSVVFTDCLNDMEEDIWHQFFHTAADDYEQRELLYLHLNAVKGIKEKLTLWQGEAEMVRYNMKLQGALNEK